MRKLSKASPKSSAGVESCYSDLRCVGDEEGRREVLTCGIIKRHYCFALLCRTYYRRWHYLKLREVFCIVRKHHTRSNFILSSTCISNLLSFILSSRILFNVHRKFLFLSRRVFFPQTYLSVCYVLSLLRNSISCPLPLIITPLRHVLPLS